MLPAKKKLHPDKMSLQHAIIEPPCFAGQIKRAQFFTFRGRALIEAFATPLVLSTVHTPLTIGEEPYIEAHIYRMSMYLL